MTKEMTKQEQMEAAWAQREAGLTFKHAKPVFVIEEESKAAMKNFEKEKQT